MASAKATPGHPVASAKAKCNVPNLVEPAGNKGLMYAHRVGWIPHWGDSSRCV